MKDFQQRVGKWVISCFGINVAHNVKERNYRFLEESLELVQSLNLTKDEAINLVNYVYGRPKGVPYQEVGGVMVTVAALCEAIKLDLIFAAETEYNRIQSFNVTEKIKIKQANKPDFIKT